MPSKLVSIFVLQHCGFICELLCMWEGKQHEHIDDLSLRLALMPTGVFQFRVILSLAGLGTEWPSF